MIPPRVSIIVSMQRKLLVRPYGADQRDAVVALASQLVDAYMAAHGGDCHLPPRTDVAWWAYSLMKYELSVCRAEDDVARLRKENADLRQANLSLTALIDREPSV